MLYDYTTVTTKTVAEEAAAALEEANRLIEEAISAGPTAADRMALLNQAAAVIAVAYGRSAFMARVHPDAEVRAAGIKAEEALNKWGVEVVFRPDLYEALKELDEIDDRGTPEQERLLEFWMRDMRRAGHGLSKKEQTELKNLRERLVELTVAFQANIDAYEDYITVTRDELSGLPDSYVKALKPGSEKGTFRVSLDYPDLFPFLEHAAARDKRRDLTLKRRRIAVEENRPLLEEALAARRRIAEIVGYESWAHHSMDVKMAKHPGRVDQFYADLLPSLHTMVKTEHDVMRRMLGADEGTTDLMHWDTSYYTNKIREVEFGVDQYAVAEYFPLDAVIDGIFDITQRVFGLTYRPVEEANAWQEDVLVHEITDAGSGDHVAYFYMDLFPREGKYGHAAAFDLVPGHETVAGEYVRPVAAMVANFTKPTPGTPSLLRHEEVLTLFHEFGHILHQCLTRAQMVRFSGANTEWDFVEAPSQIMENWCWDADVLRQFSRHYQTGEKIPVELVKQLVAARDVNVAVFNLGQAYFGVLDMQIHDDSREWDLETIDRETYEQIYRLPFPEGTFFLAGFGHLMGGYDAGYYGYLWSKVFGDDMYSRFQDEGPLDPNVGMDYRRVILEQGGTKDANELLVEFLGREPNNEAFLRNLGIR
jgi:thimet oligopeptidase